MRAFLQTSAVGLAVVGLVSCAQPASIPRKKPVVILYCAVDEVVARPLIAEFEQRSGIDVREVFDSEATKSVGLAVRLVGERSRPRADVFWNGEFSRTIFLQQKGVLAPYRSPIAADLPARYRDPDHQWSGYACRTRVIAFNPRRVPSPPRSIFDLTAPKWKGRAALCDPLIGTAASWAAALYLTLGEARADRFFGDLKRNRVKIVPGNSVVADLIVKGIVDVGVTDSDDVFVRRKQGKAIQCILPDQDRLGTLAVPCTIALIRGAPHELNARRLIDFLLSPRVERALQRAAGHIPVRNDSTGIGERVQELAQRELQVTTDKAVPAARLQEDLAADRLAQLEFFVALEQEFELKIPTADTQALRTLGDCSRYVQRRMTAAPATPYRNLQRVRLLPVSLTEVGAHVDATTRRLQSRLVP